MKFLRQNRNILIFCLILAVVFLGSLFLNFRTTPQFSGENALNLVKEQLEMGPRTPGSAAHKQLLTWASQYFTNYGWKIQIEEVYRGQYIRNLIADKGNGEKWILLGAHYDSRMIADQDPQYPAVQQAVNGANDGASGVAVLLELARVLEIPEGYRITLVLFDAEDQGRIDGWEWIMGSRYFAESLGKYPDAVVIVDMVGDSSLNLPREINSDIALQTEIWNAARDLGYGKIFSDEIGYSMLDDHTPFLDKGIPAVDIIDFDYPYWHTTEDTLDKVSADSLEAVGRTLQYWVEESDAIH